MYQMSHKLICKTAAFLQLYYCKKRPEHYDFLAFQQEFVRHLVYYHDLLETCLISRNLRTFLLNVYGPFMYSSGLTKNGPAALISFRSSQNILDFF